MHAGVEALHPALGADEASRRFRKGRDREHDVRVVVMRPFPLHVWQITLLLPLQVEH